MNPLELAEKLGFQVVVAGDGAEREIKSVYCCDLLSIVMGRAPADSAWITVMGNINSAAVAVLADVSCIILSENMQCDADCKAKAEEQGVCILQTEDPTFVAGRKVQELLS